MNKISNEIEAIGNVYLTVLNDNGTTAKVKIKNKVLNTGVLAMVKALSNSFGGDFNLYISRMLFGTNGTSSGTPKVVEETRTGLFGTTAAAKSVVSNISVDGKRISFSATLLKTDMVGETLNKMALELADGNLFSMTTFGDISKTNTMQLTWDWEIYIFG